MVRTIRIHPAIGVARLGASSTEDFVGPERRWDIIRPPGGFRDAHGLLKRQGARFRLFLYDDGQAPRELLPADGTATWTVHLANTKAAAELFHGAHTPTSGMRNAGTTNRADLVLDAGMVSVSGQQQLEAVSRKAFQGHPNDVTLGTVRANDAQLTVLGGFGISGSPTGAPLTGPLFADRDGWFDDVADGPVTATVRMADGSMINAVPAWVIVAPPKFAPDIHPVVTLYDTLLQAAIDRGQLPDPTTQAGFKPSFTNDIYPILHRALSIPWVYSPEFPVAPSFHAFMAVPAAARQRILSKLSTPATTAGGPGSRPGSRRARAVRWCGLLSGDRGELGHPRCVCVRRTVSSRRVAPAAKWVSSECRKCGPMRIPWGRMERLPVSNTPPCPPGKTATSLMTGQVYRARRLRSRQVT